MFFQQFKLNIFKIEISKRHIIESDFLFLVTLKTDGFDESESEIKNSSFFVFFFSNLN